MFGLANFSLARRVPLDLDAIAEALVEHLPAGPVESFRIAVRRADKRFPVPSPEVERVIGRRVQDARGWRVDLSEPAFEIGVEIVAEGRVSTTSASSPAPAGCRWAPPDASPACSRAASTRRSRRGA